MTQDARSQASANASNAGMSQVSTAWLEEQLRAALQRIEGLTREVSGLRAGIASREHEVLELQQQLALVDARTRRHETGQDLARELQQTVADIDERLGEEAALRRERLAATERVQAREQQSGASLEQALLTLTDRVAELERAQAGTSDRQARLTSEVTARASVDSALEVRIEELAAQITVLADATRRDTSAGTVQDDTINGIGWRLQSVEARAEMTAREQQRIAEELVTLARLAAQGESLADVLEQQRVLRQRVEDGLASLTERAATFEDARAEQLEELRLQRAQYLGTAKRLDVLAAQVAAQRDFLLEHFQRATLTAEEAGRRQVEEIDRQTRAARQLLVRLAESADEASREQPL